MNRKIYDIFQNPFIEQPHKLNKAITNRKTPIFKSH